jgi:hypothetical protein
MVVRGNSVRGNYEGREEEEKARREEKKEEMFVAGFMSDLKVRPPKETEAREMTEKRGGKVTTLHLIASKTIELVGGRKMLWR